MNRNLSDAQAKLAAMLESLDRQGALLDELQALNNQAKEIVQSMEELPELD